jgi:hypothetical protein
MDYDCLGTNLSGVEISQILREGISAEKPKQPKKVKKSSTKGRDRNYNKAKEDYERVLRGEVW